MGVLGKLVPVAVLLAGVGVGGGAAVATLRVVGPPAPARADAHDAEGPTSFVPVPKILAPLVLAGGGLSGYVTFDVEVEVAADDAATVTQKVPLLLHAINMRTYRTPLAAGPEGQLPDIARLRAVVAAAAPEAFGRGVVKRVAVTRAEPS